jgi:type IV pilus assembly protein PilE
MQFARKSAGFTLVELIIAMVIAAILAAIAIPAYSSYVRKARRTDAKSALLDLASLEERYFSVNNSYTTDSASLGYPGGNNWPYAVGSGYYTISQPTVAVATAAAAATYTLQANATGDQTKDTLCTTFTLTSAGLQTSTDTTNNSCWH